jgi:hypothetical protein
MLTFLQVDFMQGRAEQFRALLGEDYDLVGFDPRCVSRVHSSPLPSLRRSDSGVGRTYPKIELFRSEAEVVEWDIRLESSTPLNSTPDALARAHAQSLVYSSLAADREAHAGQYVSTALAARDMLRIVEAYGEHVRPSGFERLTADKSRASIIGASPTAPPSALRLRPCSRTRLGVSWSTA